VLGGEALRGGSRERG